MEEKELTRAEKRALKELNTTAEKGTKTATEESKEVVTVRKEALDNLISRLEKLESKGVQEIILDNDGKEIARMRTYAEDGRDQAKLVIDWKNIKAEKTLEGKFLIYEITLVDREGEESKVEMRLEDFIRNTELTTVTILDKKTEKKSTTDGTIMKMEVEGYSMVPRGRVANVVTWEETICKIRTAWGQDLTINANRLNQ